MVEQRPLISRTADGEAGALDEIVRAHRSTVLRTATHLLGDPESAEDVTQDVFVRLQVALPGFRGDAEVGTWLYRVTLNLCRDHYRKRRRMREVPMSATTVDPPADDLGPDAELAVSRTRAAVRAAIDRLPADQKEVIVLRYLSDLSYAEIARVTGHAQGTVASRVFRALKRLGEELEPKHLETLP